MREFGGELDIIETAGAGACFKMELDEA